MEPEVESSAVYVNSVPTRIFHWVNVLALGLMVWSGLLIYWAHDPYDLQIGSFKLLHFFPQQFYDQLGLGRQLAKGMAWHFLAMWLFAVNVLTFLAIWAWRGEWRSTVPTPATLKLLLPTVRDDLLGRPVPLQGKRFNAAQRLAYSSLLLALVGSLLTGLAIYKPTQLRPLLTLLGGYEAARREHFWLLMFYPAFTLVHVLQVLRAGPRVAWGMVIGYVHKKGPQA